MDIDPSFLESVESDLLPKLKGSALSVSLLPEGETDIKFAIELGLCIMLDKPIIAVVRPDVKVPAKLAKVVDSFIEADMTTTEGIEKLALAVNAEVEKLVPSEKE